MSRRTKNILQGSFMGKKSYDVSSFNAPFTEPANGIGDTKLNEKGDTDTEEEVKEDIKKVSFKSLFRYADRKDKIYVFLGILLSVVCGVCVPVGVYIFCTFLQAMVDYAITVALGDPQVDTFLEEASTFAIYYSVIGTAMIICTYAATVLMNLAAYRQIYRIRQEYLKAALNQDFEYFDMHDTGDFASKMTDDVVKLESGIGEKLGTFIYFQAAFVSSLLMALVLGWKLALLCLVVFPVALVLIGATGVIAAKLSKKETVATSKAGSIAEEVLSSIRTVYAFSGQEKDLARYQVPLAEARNINKKKAIFSGLINGFIFFSIFCSYAVSFWFGFNLMINEPDNYDVFIMTTVLFCIMMATSNFGISTTIMQVFGTATGAGAHVFHLLENVPKINTFKNDGFVPETLDGNIEFRNVDFFYPSRPTVQVLKAVSLNLKSGKSVALVGHSGCGKSTIVQLILRFYDTNEGQVLIDGKDVRELSVQWLRSQIGLVGQEPVLFNASIRDNIRHGRPDATDVEIEAAARKANAHEFIMALQKGYDTFVGQRGTSLSGGQKQRIAIARALIRNPRILLLDEATSALDKTSEAEVQHALDKAKEGRTTVIVAHNLSTIRNVDRIYVFKTGELVETGNHEELLKNKGQYYDMVMLQGNPELDPADNESTNSKLTRELSVQSQNLAKSIGKEMKLEDDDEDTDAKIPYREVLAMNAPEWKLITIASIAALASGVALPLFSVFMGSFLEAFTDLGSDDTMNTVRNLTYIFIGIGAFSGLANFIMVYFYEVSGAYLTERLKYLMFKKFLSMEVAFYDDNKNSPGALGAKLSGESTAVQGATGIRIGTTLQAVGTFSIAIVIAMYYEWRVGLIALAFTPILIAIVYKEGKMVMAESYGAAKTMQKSSKLAVEAVANVRTVASLGREQYFIQTYSQQLRPALTLAERGAHWRGFIFGLSRGLPNYIAAAAFYAGAMFIVYNNANFDDVFRSAQGLLLGSTSAAAAFAFSADYQKAIRAAMRVKSIFNQQPTITDPHKPEVEKFKGTGQASLQNVHFNYITRPEITVLNDFNLEIESGKTIALVGASGCGKSTVIQLIERYYDPNDGTVALDGIPLKSLRLNDVRYNLGFVQQEPILFSGTIAENISYGDNSRSLQMSEIIEAAQQANIHNFIVSLPKGYDTPLGSKGTQLSGGQKQRVAIARAFIRRPKLLLLDEATSALDVESEKVVQEALERAKAGRTCITIAHRLSTIRDSDVINVISKGRVVEQGKHDYLMNLKGHYYKLHQL